MVVDYNLPDIAVKNGPPSNQFFCWKPDNQYLILGRSNNSEQALFMDKVEKDGLIVMQRPSGGETVILTPLMLVIAAQLPLVKEMKPRDYFIYCNDFIINALTNLGVENASTKGISDISIGTKKILGSAIFRGSNSIFYHAVLNIAEDISLIEKYIRHPKREPDYRLGRPHSDFVTSLWEQGYFLSASQIIAELQPVDNLTFGLATNH